MATQHDILFLTSEERGRYGIYCDQPEFKLGFNDYMVGHCRDMGNGVRAQSYDRGQECAMRRCRKAVP